MSSPIILDDDALNCGSGGGATTYMGLRIASVFIVGIGSTFGALFPVLSKRTSWLRVPPVLFDFAKYFGSGVIIATAFIHLLDPAIEELSSPCLGEAWQGYVHSFARQHRCHLLMTVSQPYALALAMLSLFSIFIVELLAFRLGTAKLKKLGIRHDAHGHGVGGHAAHGPEGESVDSEMNVANVAHGAIALEHASRLKEGNDGKGYESDKSGIDHDEELENNRREDYAAAQVIGVAILEFGVILHSVLIGLTLAVDENFKTLFVVIVFHQLFEGLGIGSRLAYLDMPRRLNWVPIAAALLYGLTTPLGIAIGLGVRTTYNPDSAKASAVSGILDALSAGILIYTGLVELLAHEFLFSREMRQASNGKLAYALGCMLTGCGIMALLGKWA